MLELDIKSLDSLLNLARLKPRNIDNYVGETGLISIFNRFKYFHSVQHGESIYAAGCYESEEYWIVGCRLFSVNPTSFPIVTGSLLPYQKNLNPTNKPCAITINKYNVGLERIFKQTAKKPYTDCYISNSAIDLCKNMLYKGPQIIQNTLQDVIII